MRIVAGRHRGRQLEAPTGRDVRPTSDRTRQSLFNILSHGDWMGDGSDVLEGADVLDAFCGTGALALEALSHGAARAAFLDRARSSLDIARRNAEMLGEGANCRFILGDAAKPPAAPFAARLAFLDPPYGQNLSPPALTGLSRAGWLAPGALVIVEVGADDAFTTPEGFTALDARDYSQARIHFLRYHTSGMKS
ncbi:RsmD family RNA methyltransferase [Niveispirillum sp. KHB5.9]|uniref:RsmD family RNA methyltransferase n=1 Tax=Niveispirillum sp. KHB5.9 TaxID=3400269 RepID=UPI003A89E505